MLLKYNTSFSNIVPICLSVFVEKFIAIFFFLKSFNHIVCKFTMSTIVRMFRVLFQYIQHKNDGGGD